jgi:hypothetical protein
MTKRLLVLVTLLCGYATAQYIPVVATSCIRDASGSLIASGTFTVQATDDQNRPLAFRIDTTTGQAVTAPVVWTVTTGTLSAGFGTLQLADPTQTSPLNIKYHFSIKNLATGNITNYSLITISVNDGAGHFDFCRASLYQGSNLNTPVLIQGPVGTYNGGIVNAGTACTSPPARAGTIGCNPDGSMAFTPNALGVGSVYATGSIFDAPTSSTVPVLRGADCYDQEAEAMGVCNEYNDFGHAFGALAIFNPLANTTHNFNGHQMFTVSKPGNVRNIGTLGNLETLAIHQGSGTVGNAYGISSGVLNFFNAGNITRATAFDAFLQNDNSTGSFGTAYNFYAESPFGTFGTTYGYYVQQLRTGFGGGTTANYAYYAEDQGSNTNDFATRFLGGQHFWSQGTNGLTMLKMQRATDTAPTGNFLNFLAVGGSCLWTVDITGSLSCGSVPLARLPAGSSGQCIITSGGVPIWGSCAGTAGEQVLSVDMTSTSLVSGNNPTIATYTLTGTPLNSLGKSFRLTVDGVWNASGTDTLGFSLAYGASTSSTTLTTLSGTSPNGNYSVVLDCSVSVTGATGSFTCRTVYDLVAGTVQYHSFASLIFNSVNLTTSGVVLTVKASYANSGELTNRNRLLVEFLN